MNEIIERLIFMSIFSIVINIISVIILIIWIILDIRKRKSYKQAETHSEISDDDV